MKKEMEYIYMVYQKRSFSEAAKCLYISQPALSAIVKKVEDSLNTQLFDRSSKPIRVTAAGESYVSYIKQIMSIEREMDAYFSDLNTLDAGTISVGAGPFSTIQLLSDSISDFKKLHPNIHFDMYETTLPDRFEKWLDHGTCDFVIGIFPFGGESCEHIPIYVEQLILAVPKAYPINDKLREYQLTYEQIRAKLHHSERFSGVPLSSFADEKFISLHETGDLFKRCETMFSNAGISPETTTHANQTITAYFMSGSGVGISFVPDSITDFATNTGNIVFYKVDDELARRTLMIHYKKNKILSPPSKAFLDFMLARFSR